MIRIKAISDALPSVKWTLRHESTAAIGEKVTTGQIDFGLCIGTPTVATLKRRYLGEVEYALFVPIGLGSTANPSQAESLKIQFPFSPRPKTGFWP